MPKNYPIKWKKKNCLPNSPYHCAMPEAIVDYWVPCSNCVSCEPLSYLQVLLLWPFLPHAWHYITK